jgi:hypothetical protein
MIRLNVQNFLYTNEKSLFHSKSVLFCKSKENWDHLKNILHLPGKIIARLKQFFRGTLANFCKSKKCIIYNVDYRPGSKKSKFDMTLIKLRPFKVHLRTKLGRH